MNTQPQPRLSPARDGGGGASGTAPGGTAGIDALYANPYLASLYDRLQPRHLRGDFDFYLPMIHEAQSVLDVGCGTGSLLREAHAGGHAGRLCGLDPAESMLRIARQYDGVEWLSGVLADCGFREQFELIVMTGHAFQAIVEDEELATFLQSVREALVPGGCFAFETRNPDARVWERWAQEGPDRLIEPDGRTLQVTTRVTVPFDGRCVTFVETFEGDHPGLPATSCSTLRFMEHHALCDLLKQTGFRISEQYGDFRRNPVGPHAPEIITLARR